MSEPQHDIYRMAVEQGDTTNQLPENYHLLVNKAMCEIQIFDISYQLKRAIAEWVVISGWRPADYLPEVVKQTNAMCSAWAERVEKATGQRTPATNFDWEITQAIIHLKNAASVTDSNRAHLLLSAMQIAKGVRESD